MSNPTLASITAELEAVETAARGRGSLTCDHLAGRIANIRGELQQIAQPQPPAEAQPVVWQDDWMSVADLDAHLGTLAEQYEWGGDETVTINDRERLLLIDFSHGIMADEMFVAMMKAHHDPNARGRPDTAPPSAPVGVADLIERLEKHAAAWPGVYASDRQNVALLREAATALAQQPAAAGELAELVGLLDEVRSHFTRDDDLPDDLLPRIDAALAGQQGGVE